METVASRISVRYRSIVIFKADVTVKYEASINTSDIQDIAAEASFVLTNGEPLLDFPRPTLPKVVDIGGLGIRPPKPLSKVLSFRFYTSV